MNELEAILQAWQSAREPEQSAILATVVHVSGSAYRRPGARMMVLPSGKRIGSISGGCLEGDVSQKAWWLTESGRPVLRVYDTNSEEDAKWEFGLGCNGVVQVLLERLDTPESRSTMQFLQGCRQAREVGILATIIRVHGASEVSVGDRLMFRPGQPLDGSLHSTPLEALILAEARNVLARQKSSLLDCGECEVFVERIAPPLPLVIFGAGHDAVPLAAVAKALGWHVTITSSKPVVSAQERFPGVDKVVVTKADDALAGLEIGPDTAVVLMTHSYAHDRYLVRELLPLQPKYLGMLGPRDRAERILTDLGLKPVDADLHAPVGLDIGADTPQTIALAIAAEIQATFAGRSGQMLRDREGPIYAPAHVESCLRATTP
jgi:xanthine dehydrogenase accessory factor